MVLPRRTGKGRPGHTAPATNARESETGESTRAEERAHI
jgi:hypothetical protein